MLNIQIPSFGPAAITLGIGDFSANVASIEITELGRRKEFLAREKDK